MKETENYGYFENLLAHINTDDSARSQYYQLNFAFRIYELYIQKEKNCKKYKFKNFNNLFLIVYLLLSYIMLLFNKRLFLSLEYILIWQH